MDTEVEAELSMQSYLDRLDEELSKQPGFKRPPVKTIRKRRTTSGTVKSYAQNRFADSG